MLSLVAKQEGVLEDERIIALLLEGFAVPQIANRLNVSEQHVKARLAEILRRLGLNSLVELRFLALSLASGTAAEQSSKILEMLKRKV